MEKESITLFITLTCITIFAVYKIYKDKKANSTKDTKTEEFNINGETNETIQTTYIEEKNITAQDIQKECNKINDRIALTNILLLIIAIALIVIAYCTVQEYLYKKEIISNTNSAINEILEIFN